MRGDGATTAGRTRVKRGRQLRGGVGGDAGSRKTAAAAAAAATAVTAATMAAAMPEDAAVATAAALATAAATPAAAATDTVHIPGRESDSVNDTAARRRQRRRQRRTPPRCHRGSQARWPRRQRRHTVPPLLPSSATRQQRRRRPTPRLAARTADTSNGRCSPLRRYAHGARRHRLQRAPSAHVGSVIHSAAARGRRRHRTNQAQPSGNAERERGGKDGVVVGTAEAEPQHRAGAGKVSNDRRVMRKKVTTAGMATPRHGRGRNVGKGSWTAVGAATTRLAATRAGQHPRTGRKVATAGAAASRRWVLRRQGRPWQHREKQHGRRRGEQQRRGCQSQ